MIVQVYGTIFLIFALIAGIILAVFGRPFLRRWNEETRREQQHKRRIIQEKAHREAAQKEVETWELDKTTSESKESPTK